MCETLHQKGLEIAAEFEEMLSGIKVVSRTSPALLREVEKKPQALELEILGLLSRRPCNLEDLVKVTGAEKRQVNTCLHELMAYGSITSIQFNRKQYYRITERRKGQTYRSVYKY
jgi:predicted Rossmann fold nucleotide-binding protein DprA/Smf involved in DNA uptake